MAWYYQVCQLADQDITAARNEAEQMLAGSTQLTEAAGLGYAALAHIYNMEGDFEQLRTHADLAIKTATQCHSDFLKATGLHKKGIYYWHQGRNTQALTTHLEALALREKIHDITGIAASYASLAWVAIQQNDLTRAMKLAGMSLQKANGVADEPAILRARHLISTMLGMQGFYSLALQQDSLLLPMVTASGSIYGQSLVYNNMANCYAFMDQPQKAIDLHLKTLALDEVFGNSKQIGDTYCSLGLAYQQKKDFGQANRYYHMALHEFTNNGHLEGLRNTMLMLSGFYETVHQADSALHWRKAFEAMKDSVINVTSMREYHDLQIQFDASQKENTIALLARENKLQTTQRQKDNILYLSLLGLLAIGGWGLHSFVKRKQVQHFNKQLMTEQRKRARAVIKAEEKERERVAGELHDSIGQQMSALKMHMESLHDALPAEQQCRYRDMVLLIDDTIREVRDLSHNMLPPVLKKKGLEAAVRDLIDTIGRSSDIHISADMHGLQARRDPMIDFVMFRALQEVIQNMLQHARATEVTLQLVQHEEELCLMVADNGAGFNPKAAEAAQGMGLKNIRSRIVYLNGNLEIDSTPGKGTTVTVEIPLNSFIHAKDQDFYCR